VRKKALLVGLLVVGVALLSGCELLDMILDRIGGGPGGSGGGTTTSAFPISGRMKMNLAATVWRDDGYTGLSSYAGNVATTFWSGAGNSTGGCFGAYLWDGGDFSMTSFLTCLSQDEKTLATFGARQEQANTWGGITYHHAIEGVNLPYSHKEGNSRYYRVEGTAARALVTSLEFAMWVPGSKRASMSVALEWIVGGPAALTGDAGDYIEIRLDYENTATSPFD